MTIYVAAILIVAAVALFVAAPLTEGFLRRQRPGNDEFEVERLEHTRALAVQALRELEFDFEMGKIDHADYQSLHESLERRALSAMASLEAARTENYATAMRPGARRVKPAAAAGAVPATAGPIRPANFCPHCGTRAGGIQNFCAECGAALMTVVRAASRAE